MRHRGNVQFRVIMKHEETYAVQVSTETQGRIFSSELSWGTGGACAAQDSHVHVLLYGIILSCSVQCSDEAQGVICRTGSS